MISELDYQKRMRVAQDLAWIQVGVWQLSDVVKQVQHVPGDIVELGAFRGGTAIALAAAAHYYPCREFRVKTVYAFDTFDGMPEVSPIDGHHKGDFGEVTYQAVAESFSQFPDLAETTVLVKGDICKTLPKWAKDLRLVSLVFMDCDLYEPFKLGLETLWPLLSPGGIVLGDDVLDNPNCMGARKAWMDFFGKLGVKTEVLTPRALARKP